MKSVQSVIRHPLLHARTLCHLGLFLHRGQKECNAGSLTSLTSLTDVLTRSNVTNMLHQCCDQRLDQSRIERMTESPGSETPSPQSNSSRLVGRPFQKGVSGNPAGRPKIEARVRRYARKYDRRMCKVLAEIAEDPKQPVSERRRAAMDLIAVGSGRPAVVQEIAGKNGAPVGPLVSLNFGAQSGPLSPEQAYRLMLEGQLAPDPAAFQRPPIEGRASTAEEKP